MIFHDYIYRKIHINIPEVHLLIYNHVFFSKALQLLTYIQFFEYGHLLLDQQN